MSHLSTRTDTNKNLTKKMFERRRARKRKEGEEAFRYMVRTLIELNSPVIIVENGERNDRQ